MGSSGLVFSPLSIVLAAVFCAAGGSKLAGAPAMRQTAAHLRISPATDKLVGALELAAVAALIVGFWAVGLAIAASAGLVLLMLGAVLAHRRVDDQLGRYMPALVLGLLAAGNVVLLTVS
ncbi:DoxX family protein [Amycolatopsis sp. 195334CR]|uniref:DoxX family protein n=1 Tax=Amycolatopsis sp. 195334CR TaxID=2814588 RepID=UPI001A90A0A1|nr:DoxX family protein [Amycolatopsis sp. 195334CR]MBN6035862.1 DoxX family protein [Amycolatopsis sp. 195334CR]